MRLGDRVAINTDTVFAEDGVPVSIHYGLTGRFIADEGKFIQVVIWWMGGTAEVVGVPRQHVSCLELV